LADSIESRENASCLQSDTLERWLSNLPRLQGVSMSQTKRRLSTDDAAEYLGVSPKLLRKAVKDKKLRAYRIGDRIYRFNPADLDAFERAIGKDA
jgi:excisionase family DNA binding protein